jgi:antitoxin MazE
MLVSKWGNSLAVRLPKKLVEQMGLAEGDEVEIVATRKGTLEVEKIDRRAAFLKAMERFRLPLPKDYRFDREEANKR